jgi:hypothetical protein
LVSGQRLGCLLNLVEIAIHVTGVFYTALAGPCSDWSGLINLVVRVARDLIGYQFGNAFDVDLRAGFSGPSATAAAMASTWPYDE